MNDGQLRDILPLLRPRSAEPTLFSQTVWYLLWIGVTVLIVLYFYRIYRQRKQRHAEFLVFCQEAGISDAQTRLLERIARARKLRQPERLLSNAHTFERQVGGYAQDLARKQRKSKQLRQIARLREDLGFNYLPVDQALISTRQIDRGQTVLITDVDERTLEEILVPWLILDRDEAVIELSPLLREAAGHDHQRGEDLTVRFWREGDTEYEFHTHVRSVTGQNMTITHATRVERRQHRDFYRIHVDFPLDLYGLPQAGQEEEASQSPPEEAAIAMLGGNEPADGAQDQEISEDAPQEAVTRPAGALPEPPEDAERLHVRVQNLSAGGLAILVAAGSLPDGSLPTDSGPAQWVWMINPAFEGDYPLAGVTCRAVSSEMEEGQQLVKMQFEALPSTVEKEIVQRVYQHQLDTAGGAPSHQQPHPAHDTDNALISEVITVDGDELRPPTADAGTPGQATPGAGGPGTEDPDLDRPGRDSRGHAGEGSSDRPEAA